MERPVLHLNLKRKWFDMISSGVKKTEYRSFSRYWERRFFTIYGYWFIKIGGHFYKPDEVVICFSNGYSKNRLQFYATIDAVYLGIGKAEWGAMPGKEYYCLELGVVFGHTLIPRLK